MHGTLLVEEVLRSERLSICGPRREGCVQGAPARKEVRTNLIYLIQQRVLRGIPTTPTYTCLKQSTYTPSYLYFGPRFLMAACMIQTRQDEHLRPSILFFLSHDDPRVMTTVLVVSTRLHIEGTDKVINAVGQRSSCPHPSQ